MAWKKIGFDPLRQPDPVVPPEPEAYDPFQAFAPTPDTKDKSIFPAKKGPGILGDSFGMLSPEQQQQDLSARFDSLNAQQGHVRQLEKLIAQTKNPYQLRALKTQLQNASMPDIDQLHLMEAGQKPLASKTALRSGVENVVSGFADSVIGIPEFAGIMKGYIGPGKVDDDALVKWSLGAKDYVKSLFPGDAARQGDFGQQFASGLGQIASFYGAGALAALAKAGPRATAAVVASLGSAATGSSGFEEGTRELQAARAKAAASGDTASVTEFDRMLKTMGYAALGLTEAIPVARTFSRAVPNPVTSLENRLVQTAEGALEEALQESGSQLGQNLVSQQTTDPARSTTEGVADSGAVGGALGGFMNMLLPGKFRAQAPAAVSAMGDVASMGGGTPLQPAPGMGLMETGQPPFVDRGDLRPAASARVDRAAGMGGEAQAPAETPLGNAAGLGEPQISVEPPRQLQAPRAPVIDVEAEPVPPVLRSSGVQRQTFTEADLNNGVIGVDAPVMQFKEGGDAEGVTARLKGVKEWDPVRAGNTIVYEYADGRKIVADGHQRLGLAKRLAAEGKQVDFDAFIFREVDGFTPQMVRSIAAMKNIAEGSGTAIDAAKVLRELGKTPEDLNLPPQSALARDAAGLSRLGDDAFGMVVNEIVPKNYAAIVGYEVDDPQLQSNILALLARLKPASALEARSIIAQAKDATISSTQSNLFGDETVIESLYGERAKVLAEAARQLKANKKVFSMLVANEKKAEAAGNVLNRTENERQASASAVLGDIIERLAHAKGPISDALTGAARSYRETGKLSRSASQFADAVTAAMERGDIDGLRVAGVRQQSAGAQNQEAEEEISLFGTTQDRVNLQRPTASATPPAPELQTPPVSSVDTGDMLAALAPTQTPPERDDLGYYSKALEAAHALPQPKGTSEQMRAMLKQAGVKESEIKATGLDQLLTGQPSVTKDEIILHLTVNRVQLREARYGGSEAESPNLRTLDEDVNEDGNTIVDVEDENTGDRFTITVDDDAGNVYVQSETGAFLPIRKPVNRQNYDDAIAAIERYITERSAVPDVDGDAQYEEWSLDEGNPTYRETVLYLGRTPAQQGELDAITRQIEVNKAAYRDLIGRAPGGPDTTMQSIDAHLAEVDRLNNEKGRLLAELESKLTAESSWKSGHWDEPNIVAHARHQLLDTTDGRKSFNLDELQSDEAQKIREGGQRDEGKIAALSAQVRHLEKRQIDLMNAGKSFLWSNHRAAAEAATTPQSTASMLDNFVGVMRRQIAEIEAEQGTFLGDEAERLAIQEADRLSNEIGKTAREITLRNAELRTAEQGAVGHPLINTTDQWVETALRRVIQKAVDAGADGISITPGVVQNERFAKTRVIDTIRVHSTFSGSNGNREVTIYKDGGSKGLFQIDASGNVITGTPHAFVGHTLKEIAGKELADRILAVPKDKSQDIDVGEVEMGGKGMQATYDGIYPRALGKLLQKLDKSIAPQKVKVLPHGQKVGDRIPGVQGKTSPFHREFTFFPLTDKAKAALAEQGQPLFAIGASNDGRDQQAGDGAGRSPSGSLAPLKGAPVVEGATGPDPRVVAAAEQYARDNGIDLKRQAVFAKVDEALATRIAGAYDAMQHAPDDPKVAAAYADMIQQTIAQYKAIEAAGFKFFFYDEKTDPYEGNPWNSIRDLRQNQRMGVFATEAGFGSGVTDLDTSGSPMLVDTGIEWPYGALDGPKKRVLANDLFRAVHDIFGHSIEGAGFRARGEENAWQAHIRLYQGPAVGAVTSETRGQNSWLNFGPYGKANQTASVEDTVFADQKIGLMPEWTWTEGRAPDEDTALYAEALFDHNDLMREELAAGRSVFIPQAKETMAALAPVIGAVPDGTATRVLTRVVPAENDSVRAVFVAPDGTEIALTFRLEQLLQHRAFWTRTQGPDGASVPGVFLVNRTSVPGSDERVRGELRHEVIHALRMEGRFPELVWFALIDHAYRLRVMDVSLGDYLSTIGVIDKADSVKEVSLGTTYHQLYKDRANVDELLDQEAVAHMAELYSHGAWEDAEIAPIKPILDAIFAGKFSRGTPEDAQNIDLSRELAAAFAGDKARTGNPAMKARAIELESKNVPWDEIWELTGYIRGNEGRWRFEINDSGSTIKVSDADFAYWMDKEENEPGQGMYLEDFFDHPELYEAYPFLKKIDVTLDLGLRFGSAGYAAAELSLFDRLRGKPNDLGRIELGMQNYQAEPMYRAEMRRVLMHEIQHVIQRHEGHAYGSNPEHETLGIFKRMMHDTLTAQDIAILKKTKKSANNYAVWRKAKNTPGKSYVAAEMAEVLAQYAGDPLYRQQSGEIEARMAFDRTEMSAEDRQRWAPDLTDALDDNQIGIRFADDPLAAFAGEQAKTADKTALSRAKAAIKSGTKPEQVWKQHGWYKGFDGKWRFEIDDSQMTFKQAFVDAFNAALEKARNSYTGRGGTVRSTVGAVIDHPQLFDAYPALRDTPVRIGQPEMFGGAGSYDRDTRAIEVNASTMEDVATTLLHEIQHWLQQEEGFAVGGNPTIQQAANEKSLFEIEQQMAQIEAAGLGHNSLPYLREVRDALIESIQRLDNFASSLAYSEPQKAVYRAIAGEVEARNTQKRQTMSTLERRLRFPDKTQDTTREDMLLAGEPASVAYANEAELRAAAGTAYDEITNGPGWAVASSEYRLLPEDDPAQKMGYQSVSLTPKGYDSAFHNHFYFTKQQLTEQVLENGPLPMLEAVEARIAHDAGEISKIVGWVEAHKAGEQITDPELGELQDYFIERRDRELPARAAEIAELRKVAHVFRRTIELGGPQLAAKPGFLTRALDRGGTIQAYDGPAFDAEEFEAIEEDLRQKIIASIYNEPVDAATDTRTAQERAKDEDWERHPVHGYPQDFESHGWGMLYMGARGKQELGMGDVAKVAKLAEARFPEEVAAWRAGARLRKYEQLTDYVDKVSSLQNAFAGIGSEAANFVQLAKAELLEADGKGSWEIWQETGWTRGLEGDWKFEVDDSGSEWISSFKQIKEFAKDQVPVKLDSVFKHDKLYEAYPHLRKVKVLFSNNQPFEAGGFDAGKNLILLGIAPFQNERSQQMFPGLANTPQSLDLLKSCLLHELQHAIQKAENFAWGANPETEASNFSARLSQDKLTANDMAVMEHEGLLPYWKNYKNIQAILEKPLAETETKAVQQKRKKMVDLALERRRYLTERMGWNLYRRSAGEGEARLAQHRRDYDEAARQDTPPNWAAQYPRQQMVVMRPYGDLTVPAAQRYTQYLRQAQARREKPMSFKEFERENTSESV